MTERFLLDSADLTDIDRAVETGLIRSVTTNPALMRQAVSSDPLAHLRAVLERPLDRVYYQPTSRPEGQLAEAVEAFEAAPERVVIKAMATPTGIRLASELGSRSIPVALTGVQFALGMPIAESLGCVAAIHYFDRASRNPDGPSDLLAELIEVGDGTVPIMAGSIKSPGQAYRALSGGAESVTVPMSVLEDCLTSGQALAAEQQFEAAFNTG